MYIFELEYPGSFLDLDDPERASQIRTMFHSLETALSDAAMSLNFFVSARQESKQHIPDKETWEKEAKRRQEIMESIRKKLNVDRFDPDSFEEVRFLSDIELKREKWEAGNLPRDYKNRIVFIHAKSFLFAIDRIKKFINAISKFENIPKEVPKIKNDFETSFPDLRQVRNSSAHMEDRVQKIGPGGKEIDPKPISNSMIHAPHGGVMINESLVGNKFGSTMADGHYGEVEVSFKSVKLARKYIQKIIEAFEWKGSKSHYPK